MAKSKKQLLIEKRREKIRNDLLEQLEERGILGAHYEDLIEDYMCLWDIKNQLAEDVKKRGVSTEWRNSETSFGQKKNDSIGELNKTNGQMLKILSELGLKPTGKAVDVHDADEEM